MKSLIEAGSDINGVDFDGNTPFFDAIVSSDSFPALEIRLNTILELGGVANTVNHRGQTALHRVACLGFSDPNDYAHPGITSRIDFLLQERLGIDLHARDNEGSMAIHCAASISEFITWKLVQAGANTQPLANDGRNPLHFAAVNGQSNAVGLLCNLYGESSSMVDQKDESGRTPLHYATSSGSSESVYYLLQSGADPNIKDKQGLTPLHACAEHTINTAEIRKHRRYGMLLGRRNIPLELQKLYPFMDTRKGSPIYEQPWKLNTVTCQEEESRSIQDVVSLLLVSGADSGVHDTSGQTPYEFALFLDNEALANVLSPLNPQANIASPLLDQWYSIRSTISERLAQSINFEGIGVYTILQSAISLGNEAILDSLLKAGADPTAVGPDALTPVHTITHWGLISMMKIVVPYIRDLNIFSPPLLHVAAAREQSNLQMVNLLIELGIDVNASYQEVDDECRRFTGAPIPSYSAAHILAMGMQWWNISALESLCKVGANMEMTDGDGNTALQCALNGNKCGSWGPGFWRDQTLEVVLQNGADINALSPGNGATPLATALESKRGAALIRKLLDAGADINIGEVPAIFIVIESENFQATKAIIDAGGDVNALYRPEQPRWYGMGPKVETPLLAAAMCDRYSHDTKRKSEREAIMTLLLQHGADPLMNLGGGESSVFHLISFHHGLVVPILKLGIDCEIRDSQNRTPLLLACSEVEYASRATEDGSTPRELILAGANIHAIDTTGSTPLHLAARIGNTKIATLLLEKGASVSTTDDAGLTPLYYVLKHTHFAQKLELSKALISAGAEPLIKGPDGESPLHLLAPTLLELTPANDGIAADINSRRENKIDFLAEFKALYQHFVDSGCDRNARDDLGNSPLWPYVQAVKYRNDYIIVNAPADEDIKEVLDHHAVFAVNDEGDTLLHAVAARVEGEGSEPDGLCLFKELMRRGVDARKQNKKGVSALDVAAACGKEEILGLFAREE